MNRNRKQRQRLNARKDYMALRDRIIAALLANAPILKLRWRTIVSDIRRRYGCSQELAHEALSEVHAVRPRA